MSEINKDLKTKIKELLQITDDKPSWELYEMLYEFRTSMHPDKYLDELVKKTVEEKFKEANQLLQELSTHIEQEKISNPSGLVPYKADLHLVKSRQETLNLEAKNEHLKSELFIERFTNENLKKEVAQMKSSIIDSKTEELIKHYEPSKDTFLRYTITFVLTAVIGVLTQVEKITQLLSKYSPLKPDTLKIFLFVILVLVPVKYLADLYVVKKVEFLAKKVKTPAFANKFMAYLENNNSEDTFSEYMVYDFLTKTIIPKFYVKKVIFQNILPLYVDPTIDSLKDIFIYNLLKKQFITITSARNLDRTFKIQNYKKHNFPVEPEDAGFDPF